MVSRVIENRNELPELPPGLSYDDKFDKPRKFGSKIVEVDGVYSWEPATEHDFRMAEAERLGISPDAVEWDNCDQIGPDQCLGTCISTPKTWCKLLYHPRGRYYYCACTE